MRENEVITDYDPMELEALFSDEYDETSDEDWIENLIDSEDGEILTEDAPDQEETGEAEKESEEGNETSASEDGLSIDEPEEEFFDMELSPSEAPVEKMMQVRATKVNARQNNQKKSQGTIKKENGRRKGMLAKADEPQRYCFAKSKPVQEHRELLWDIKAAKEQKTEKKDTKEKQDKNRKENLNATEEKHKGLRKQQIGFTQCTRMDMSGRKMIRADHMCPMDVKEKVQHSDRMDFRQKQEESCLPDRFCYQPAQSGMVIRERKPKKADPMGL